MTDQKIFYKPIRVQQLLNADLLHNGNPALIQKQLFVDASDMTFIEIGGIDGYDYSNIVLPAFNKQFGVFDDYSRKIAEDGKLDIEVPKSVSPKPFKMRRADFDDMVECTGLTEVQSDIRMFSRTMDLPEAAFNAQSYTLYLYLKECYLFLMGMPQAQSLLMASYEPGSPSPEEVSSVSVSSTD